MPRVDREWPIVTLVREMVSEEARGWPFMDEGHIGIEKYETEDYVPKRIADELRDAMRQAGELLRDPENHHETARIEADEVLKRAER